LMVLTILLDVHNEPVTTLRNEYVISKTSLTEKYEYRY